VFAGILAEILGFIRFFLGFIRFFENPGKSQIPGIVESLPIPPHPKPHKMAPQ
jgi:hypothetical protein